MVVIPHTMAVCLIYSSMQAPGLFVPDLTACKEQGLFTFSPGRRKQAALTFMLHSRGAFWMEGCFTFTLHKLQSTAPESISSLSLSLPGHCHLFSFSSLLLYFCLKGRFPPLENTNRSECQGEQQQPQKLFLSLF